MHPIDYAPSRRSQKTPFADRFMPALILAIVGVVLFFAIGFLMGNNRVIDQAFYDVCHSAVFPCY